MIDREPDIKRCSVFILNQKAACVIEMLKPFYCIKECLVWSCSVSINSCKSESVKLLPEATLKVTNGENSCTDWANACAKHQLK